MKQIDANYLWIWQFWFAPIMLISLAEELNEIYAGEKYEFSICNIVGVWTKPLQY